MTCRWYYNLTHNMMDMSSMVIRWGGDEFIILFYEFVIDTNYFKKKDSKRFSKFAAEFAKNTNLILKELVQKLDKRLDDNIKNIFNNESEENIIGNSLLLAYKHIGISIGVYILYEKTDLEESAFSEAQEAMSKCKSAMKVAAHCSKNLGSNKSNTEYPMVWYVIANNASEDQYKRAIKKILDAFDGIFNIPD